MIWCKKVWACAPCAPPPLSGSAPEHSYIDLMNVILLEPVEQMFRDKQHPFVFQYEDNVLCHKAMAMLAWFKNNDRHNVLCPPQFPDVNHIENIWSWMKKDAWEVKPTTCEDIKAALFRSFDITRSAKIITVFLSFLRRAAAITRSCGYPTK